MSAFVVSHRHIDLLLATAINSPRDTFASPGRGRHTLRWYWGNGRDAELRFDNADEVGAMLYAECVRSVMSRYPQDTRESLPGCGEGDYLEYRDPHYRLTPVEALKAIRCYEYQSCETEDWEQTEAHAFCQAFTEALIYTLHGMDDAPWEWSDHVLEERHRDPRKVQS